MTRTVPSVVAVHGVGNHNPDYPPAEVAADLANTWAMNLAAGLGTNPAGIRLSCAYYAHHLHAGMPVAQGPADDGAAALDLLERTSPEAVALAAEWLAAVDLAIAPLELEAATAQGRLLVPLRQGVSVMAKVCGGLDGAVGRAFAAKFLREVTVYLAPGPNAARDAAREEVAEAIAASGARIVIAHSLGTVVTYEALHAHPELGVDLLLTLGSPLALQRGVFDRLQPAAEDGTGQRPPGVRRWVNVADHGDLVAVPRPFKKWFPEVEQDLDVSIAPFDFHRAAHYLRSSAVATTVGPYLL